MRPRWTDETACETDGAWGAQTKPPGVRQRAGRAVSCRGRFIDGARPVVPWTMSTVFGNGWQTNRGRRRASAKRGCVCWSRRNKKSTPSECGTYWGTGIGTDSKRKDPVKHCVSRGLKRAAGRTRTVDLSFTKASLCQLSYGGRSDRRCHTAEIGCSRPTYSIGVPVVGNTDVGGAGARDFFMTGKDVAVASAWNALTQGRACS